MAIQGLGKNARFPRAGVFKIGKKVNNRPVALDHFVIKADNAEAIEAVYGKDPKRIDVYLPGNIIPAIWDANYKYYTTNGLYCKGDGVVGRYMDKGEMKERPCADMGCEFAQGDKPKCRPTGVLSFKLVDVNSVGIYQVTVRGMVSIERIHGFLMALQAAAGGDVTGIPFGLQVEQVQSAARKFHVIAPIETDATAAVLASGKRLAAVGVNPEIEIVDEYVIEGEDGEFAANLQVPEGEEVGSRAEFAALLNKAISNYYLVGQSKLAYLKVLNQLSSMTEEEAQERLSALKVWLDEFESTKHDPSGMHESDARMAATVFKHMTEEDYELLGINVPGEPSDLTRIEVRRATDFLTSTDD